MDKRKAKKQRKRLERKRGRKLRSTKPRQLPANGSERAHPPTPRQFDFARNWRQEIVPHLDDVEVDFALTLGMIECDLSFRPGDPPWKFGRCPPSGKTPRRGQLEWYQPWGRCHYIAPFCWALGRAMFPELKWGFISSNRHTVVVGHDDVQSPPVVVMDILLFWMKTAEESLDYAMAEGWKFYDSLARYSASSCTQPEQIYPMMVDFIEEMTTPCDRTR